jgi:hypothetical protein
VGGRVIGVGFVAFVLGLVAGMAATWGLDPAEEPEGGVHAGTGVTGFVVFADAGLSDAEVAALETELQERSRIDAIDYLGREDARAMHAELFPEAPDQLGTAFRFEIPTAEEPVVEELIADLDRTTGVAEVVATLETRAVLATGEDVRWG